MLEQPLISFLYIVVNLHLQIALYQFHLYAYINVYLCLSPCSFFNSKIIATRIRKISKYNEHSRLFPLNLFRISPLIFEDIIDIQRYQRVHTYFTLVIASIYVDYIDQFIKKILINKLKFCIDDWII